MKFINLFKIALKALRKNVFRTFLTMLGIIIGVASVITMLAIGQGSKDSIEGSISDLGSNLVMVLPGSSDKGGVSLGLGTSKPLDTKAVKDIAANCPSVKWVSPVSGDKAQLVAGSNNWLADVVGGNEDYVNIRSWKIHSGRNFTKVEERRAAKVCLLGKTVVEELFGTYSNPIGKTIRINYVPFKIIGLLEGKGADIMGDDQDDVVIAPFTTVQRRLLGSTKVQMIFASAYSNEVSETAKKEIEAILLKSLRVKKEDEVFSIATMEELTKTLTSASKTLVILLASIAAISLLVGGIGIMNIMYVTVKERTREVGLRMAVGAKGRDILLQFLTEATFISFVGGTIGVLLGMVAAMIFGEYVDDWEIVITPFSILLAFGCSFLVGVFFGWYPARKAANLIPIEALRYE